VIQISSAAHSRNGLHTSICDACLLQRLNFCVPHNARFRFPGRLVTSKFTELLALYHFFCVQRTVLLRRGSNVHAIRQLSLATLRSHLPSTGNSNMKLGLQCFGFSVFARDLALDIFLFNLVSR
jgi:hypothetical protein